MNSKQAILDHIGADAGPFYQRYFPDLNLQQAQTQVRCPFHEDRTPSLSIQLQGAKLGCWHCHGCGKGGDLFDFYAASHQLSCDRDFPEILRRLSEALGIAPSASKTETKNGRQPKSDALERFRQALKGKSRTDLMRQRGLTDEVIHRFQIGLSRNKLVFPIWDETEQLLGFKVHRGPHLRPDGRPTPRGKGVPALVYPKPPRIDEAGPLWVAEGEPDVWRLAVEGHRAITGTAGASHWRDEWTECLRDKDLIVAYDNDEAGRKGQAKVVESLKHQTGRLRQVVWPEDTPQGYDLTDWLQAGRSLDELPLIEVTTPKITLAQAKEVIGQWLHTSPSEACVIDVVLGAMVANRFSGDPVWLFIVGPPGIIKTEILRTLDGYEDAYLLSSLTGSTLISGYVGRENRDPSLLPQLDGKVLIVKDFTAILDMPHEARQQIMGDLRDAYDGQMAKAFGSEAGTRTYQSKFGLIAAVTPAIDKYSSVGQQLGERFLKLRVTAADRQERIRRALDNSGQEAPMRQALSEAIQGVLRHCTVHDEQMITLEEPVKERIVLLADTLAILRSMVARDGYSKVIEYIPEAEIGTRLAKQFAKLARGIAAVRGEDGVTQDIVDLMCRIGRDTLPTKRCKIVKILYDLFEEGPQSIARIAEAMEMPETTIKYELEDLRLLEVVERQSEHQKVVWRLAAPMKAHLDRVRFFAVDRTDSLEVRG